MVYTGGLTCDVVESCPGLGDETGVESGPVPGGETGVESDPVSGGETDVESGPMPGGETGPLTLVMCVQPFSLVRTAELVMRSTWKGPSNLGISCPLFRILSKPNLLE